MLKRAAICHQEAAVERVLRSVPQVPVQRYRGSASLGLPSRSYIRTPVLPARPNPRRADLGHHWDGATFQIGAYTGVLYIKLQHKDQLRLAL